uniref:Zinc finger protein 2-like n=1 Tax=Dermatophagoides pteronyssinus TaxID=6956 RepID=A0A6P6XQT6_DERPT|nr:zinc finger protein 2-like [Dermatophagoides pteronyssinus]
MSYDSLSQYGNYVPQPPPQPQPQQSWPNYFNPLYQQPQQLSTTHYYNQWSSGNPSHHQYNQDVWTHRPAYPFGGPPYPEQQYSHANISPWINQNIPSHSDSVQFHQLQQHDYHKQNNKRQRSNDDNNNEQIKKYFQNVFKCNFCKTIVKTVDDATVHLTDYHKIEQTTIDNFDNDIQSILQDCNDDSLTSSQFHFLRGDSDGDRYDERFNNSLSSWFIESENELDNTIESPLINESSDVEIVEETIVDVNETIDDQSKTETTFTNDDKDKTEEKSLTTTIVESKLDEDFFNEYDQNIENEKSDDLFETTINSKTTTNDPNIENNDPKTIENFPNDETLPSSSSSIIESSEVEIVEETIVDDHQSAETIFTLTNDNDDEDKTKKKLTTTIVESIVDEDSAGNDDKITNGNQLFKCPECPATFTKLWFLKRHSSSHSNKRPYHCDQCDARFKFRYSLKRHSNIHNNQRPYKCSVCNAAFGRSDHLKNHQQRHSDQRPHICQQCNAGFKTKGDLKDHSFCHSNKLPFHCDHCDKKFKSRKILRSHQQRHSEKKPFNCQECNAEFKTSAELKKHSILHSDQRPFKCSICDATFKHRDSFRIHQQRHSNKRPHICLQGV